ncbi:MAG: HDIG domain-containing protein [Parachlamydiales bacterium]|nr:HDIG domain-containing protein [Parachlamydiales bacterium]
MKKKLNLKKKLEENNLGWRFLVGFVFLIALAIFLHFKEFRVDVLDLHTKAPKYVVSQIDFNYPDDEKTILLKQKRLSDLGEIFKIDTNQIKQIRLNFEKFIINNGTWKNFENISYEKINDLTDQFENILIRSRFVDSSTMRKMKLLKINVKNFISLDTSLEEDNFSLPNGYFLIFSKRFSNLTNDKSQEVINYIVDFFKSYDFQLKKDVLTHDKLRRVVETYIPQKYSKISAGEQIIAKGEKVNAKHMTMLSSMKKAIDKKRNLFEPLTILGNIVISFILVILSILYFNLENPALIRSLRKLSLVITILILTLIFAKTIEISLLKSTSFVIEAVRYPIIVPFATILFCVLFNSRISLYFSTFLSIVLGITLAVDTPSFLVINLVTSLVVIITSRFLRKRTEVFIVCLKCMLVVIPLILASSFVHNRLFSVVVVTNIISAFLLLFIIGVLVVGLLPPLEAFFDVLTDITLMEYMDPNNELLRRMTLEVPGSYQHSLVLGNLSESAALKIGANGLFCRVATLYHDIGKLNNPNYFIENQNSGINIHQLLTPVESASVIISHITDGEMLARKYRLPNPIIDIIKEHHGTTLVYYFFSKQVNLQGDIKKVNEEKFRYPGPKPSSKESAIIMISDSVEAASRSLVEMNEKNLTQLVEKIVKQKADDGQFDDCSLTFEEIKTVKESLVNTLMLTRHVRIKYPEAVSVVS